ncbi:MAG TPA: DUF1080 domain-containing protein [Polyangiaceae bacterium]|nr:DUF1080 domain-containing protein [Polyangiaceae bacterium]
MQSSLARAWLLVTLTFTMQLTACGLVRSGAPDLASAGSSSDHGGSETDGPAQAGGSAGTLGGDASLGGNTTSEAGSASLGGGGMGGATGATAGAAGATAGATGATAGGGTGGALAEPAKIVLFDGSKESFDSWIALRNRGANPWKDNGDGTMTVGMMAGDIQSKETFRNVFVHVEYVTPKLPIKGGGQQRGNSGVLLNGSYELQILSLEAFDPQPTDATCGAVFGLIAPLQIACHEEAVWNTYEIEFQAPLCTAANVTTPARFVEVKLNDRVIHRNVDVLQRTVGAGGESCEPRGLQLQDWSTILPVTFRNIWAIRRD